MTIRMIQSRLTGPPPFSLREGFPHRRHAKRAATIVDATWRAGESEVGGSVARERERRAS